MNTKIFAAAALCLNLAIVGMQFAQDPGAIIAIGVLASVAFAAVVHRLQRR